jgi:hypothetical protein
VPLECRGERLEARAVSKSTPHEHYQTSPRLEDAVHLAGSSLPVGNILEPELAEDRVEGCRIEGQCSRVPFPPFHRCALAHRRGACAGKHPGIEVKANHVACNADLCSGQACNHACPTRDVEHSLALTECRFCHEQWS